MEKNLISKEELEKQVEEVRKEAEKEGVSNVVEPRLQHLLTLRDALEYFDLRQGELKHLQNAIETQYKAVAAQMMMSNNVLYAVIGMFSDEFLNSFEEISIVAFYLGRIYGGNKSGK